MTISTKTCKRQRSKQKSRILQRSRQTPLLDAWGGEKVWSLTLENEVRDLTKESVVIGSEIQTNLTNPFCMTVNDLLAFVIAKSTM